jgi:hypothetical protein
MIGHLPMLGCNGHLSAQVQRTTLDTSNILQSGKTDNLQAGLLSRCQVCKNPVAQMPRGNDDVEGKIDARLDIVRVGGSKPLNFTLKLPMQIATIFERESLLSAGECHCARLASSVSELSYSPMPDARRFPPPWTIDEMNDACFIVRDRNGQTLGYFYFEEEPGRRAAAKLLTRDEARRIVVNIAKLPELVR